MNFDKKIKLLIIGKVNFYDKREATFIFNDISKLVVDNFLSERKIKSLCRSIDTEIYNLSITDSSLCLYLVDDVIESCNVIQKISVEYEKFEAAKNIKTFLEAFLLSNFLHTE